MKIIRFRYKNKTAWGVLDNSFVRLLKSEPFNKIEFSGTRISLGNVQLLAPCEPSKIILAGLNYKDHVKELSMPVPQEPVIFLKPPSSIIAHEEDIYYPDNVTRLDYEAELALVIKKEAKNISPAKVHNYVLGYTCLNDVTARDIQKKDIQWARAKSFDTFCPIGPWLETEINPDKLNIRSYLNGVIKQDSNTSNFIFSVRQLVSFISKVMTLLPGDVLSTGTPAGIGPMKISDTIEVEIEGIGRLRNRVNKL